MKKEFYFTWIVLASLIMASLACSLPFGLGEQATPTPQPPSGEAVQVGTSQAAPTKAAAGTTAPSATTPPKATVAPPTATLAPTAKAANPIPLPLRQGLASLNSYVLKIRFVANGPTKDDRSENTITYEVNTKTDSSHTIRESVSSSAEDPQVETSKSETFQVGAKSCSVSGSKSTPTGELTEDDPIAKDMATTISYMMDFTIAPENPAFVAQETVNGVQANHFTFKTTRLGKDSGAVVNKNTGDYWIAKDGQYLVKYSTVLELSSDKAGTKVVHGEMQVDLTSINQPVNVTIPAYCKK